MQAEQGGAGDDRHWEGEDGVQGGDGREDDLLLRTEGEEEDCATEGEARHPHSR